MPKSNGSVFATAILVLLFMSSSTLFSAEPNFKIHYIRYAPDWASSMHQVSLADFDNDGDLDYTVGNVHDDPNLFWFEYKDAYTWERHFIDSDDIFYGGACPIDVNNDGWMDFATAELLYINKGNGADWEKHKFAKSNKRNHDLLAVDINQDGTMDIVSNGDEEGLVWYEAGSDPTKIWKEHFIAPKSWKSHASTFPGGVADLDGDGDMDVAAAQDWFENLDGKALKWKMHSDTMLGLDGPWGTAVRTETIDMDGDGDIDVVQSETDNRGPVGIAWMENDGKGNFKRHWIKERVPEDYHSLAVFDYDNDGDLDVFSAVGPLAEGNKKTYLFENLSGPNNKPLSWKEHVILLGPLFHEGIAGDVDQDGDVDLVGKRWKTGPSGHRTNHRAIIYLENQVIQ